MVEHTDKDQSTEQKILDAAKQVFLVKGLDGARMQDIADQAGINKALLHYYFRSKDKLFEMIFQEAAIKFMPRVSILFAADMPLFLKIETFTNAYIDLLLENPYLPTFMLTEMHKQDAKQFIEKIWGGKRPPIHIFVAQIEAEVKKGLIHPINPLHLVMNLISMCIFPFAAKPMIKLVWDIGDQAFLQLMEERKKTIAQFIIDSIRK